MIGWAELCNHVLWRTHMCSIWAADEIAVDRRVRAHSSRAWLQTAAELSAPPFTFCMKSKRRVDVKRQWLPKLWPTRRGSYEKNLFWITRSTYLNSKSTLTETSAVECLRGQAKWTEQSTDLASNAAVLSKRKQLIDLPSSSFSLSHLVPDCWPKMW